MLAWMSPHLFDEWMAFSQLEPFGEGWLQTALQCTVNANGHGGKAGGGTFTVKDFLPSAPEPPPSPEQQAFAIKRAFERYAARQLKAGGGIVSPPVV